MSSAQESLPRDPPSPPVSELEALVDNLDGGASRSAEPQAAPGAEPPDL